MNYYADAKARREMPPCIHPLLLSVIKWFNESKVTPDISSISEDDPRALKSSILLLPMISHHWMYISVAKMVRGLISNYMFLCSHQQRAARNVWHLNL